MFKRLFGGGARAGDGDRAGAQDITQDTAQPQPQPQPQQQPQEDSKRGYTEALRREYLALCKAEGHTPGGLQAPTDPEAPLEWWHLFPLLGEDRIEAVVTRFYELVWGDEEEPWFRAMFTNVTTLPRAIWSQTMFWVDMFGGGHAYHGGDFRLSYHHGLVANEMNHRAGVRWMHHMTAALDQSDLGDDPRVRPAIDRFLKFTMRRYSAQYEFDDARLVDAPMFHGAAAVGGASGDGESADAARGPGGGGPPDCSAAQGDTEE